MCCRVRQVKPCAICGPHVRTDEKVYYSLPECDVMRCPRCGLLYVDTEFESEKGLGIAEGYETIYLPAEDRLLARSRKQIEHIEGLRQLKGRILDVGCGVGYFLRVARSRGWNTAGLDLDKCAVDIARSHGLDVQWETMCSARLADSFDVVTLFNVIEHVSDPRKALESAYGALDAGGLLVLETPTDDCAIGPVARLLYTLSGTRFIAPVRYLFGPGGGGEHVFRFSRKTIGLLLAETGFRVEQILPAPNTGVGFQLKQRNFGRSHLTRLANAILIGGVMGIANLVGLRTKMIAYATKTD